MGRTKLLDIDIYNLWKVYQSPENKDIKSVREICAMIKRKNGKDVSEDALKAAVKKYGQKNMQILHLKFNPKHIADDYSWARRFGEDFCDEHRNLSRKAVRRIIREVCKWDKRTRNNK